MGRLTRAALASLLLPATPLAAGTPPAPPAGLAEVASLLAARSSVHASLLYKFQCTEDVSRVLNAKNLFSGGLASQGSKALHYGMVIEKDRNGIARLTRLELTADGAVRQDPDGLPVEAVLPKDFQPLAGAVPQAQAAWFSREHLGKFALSAVGSGRNPPSYRITCGTGEIAVEFLDGSPRRVSGRCTALASGQMCVRRADGEISRLAFYPLKLSNRGVCQWDRSAPFSLVEQALVEPTSGARFPSRIRTLFSPEPRQVAVFDQVFRDCAFTNVEVSEEVGEVVEPGR